MHGTRGVREETPHSGAGDKICWRLDTHTCVVENRCGGGNTHTGVEDNRGREETHTLVLGRTGVG